MVFDNGVLYTYEAAIYCFNYYHLIYFQNEIAYCSRLLDWAKILVLTKILDWVEILVWDVGFNNFIGLGQNLWSNSNLGLDTLLVVIMVRLGQIVKLGSWSISNLNLQRHNSKKRTRADIIIRMHQPPSHPPNKFLTSI